MADGAELSDGDLVRLARDGDAVAFRLLVERHQPAARARARRLCPNPSDVDDTVQESFLQAFIALDRLREPDRFAGWLAGIVLNVCRSLYRREQLTLLSEWPEPLHPASADGLPSADDLDRADALREAVAGLPAGQRRAVALHYYADLPPSQITEAPGAARVSLHKARIRLRAHITEHRPDLVPLARRTHMTTVRCSAVPQPKGFAFLAQQIYADDYRDAVVVFRGQVRTEDAAARAGLFLRIRTPLDVRGPLTEDAALADPLNHIVMTDNREWASREVTARIPDEADSILFGVFLACRGRIELRDAELITSG